MSCRFLPKRPLACCRFSPTVARIASVAARRKSYAGVRPANALVQRVNSPSTQSPSFSETSSIRSRTINPMIGSSQRRPPWSPLLSSLPCRWSPWPLHPPSPLSPPRRGSSRRWHAVSRFRLSSFVVCRVRRSRLYDRQKIRIDGCFVWCVAADSHRHFPLEYRLSSTLSHSCFATQDSLRKIHGSKSLVRMLDCWRVRPVHHC